MRYGRPRRRRPVRRRKPAARLRPMGNPRRRVKRRKLKRNPRLASKRAGAYTISAKEWEAELARRKRSRAAKKGAATKAKKGKKKAPAKRKKAPKKKKKAAKKKAAPRRRGRTAASYKAASRKAAATKKRKAAKRSAAAKKAARTRARGASPKRKPYKRKKKAAAKRKSAPKRRRGKLTKAQRRAAALKGWRKRRGKMARTVSKRRRSYKKRKYKYSPRRRKPIGNQKVRSGYKGRRSRRKGRGGKKRRYGRIRRRVGPYMRKGRKVRRHRKWQGIRLNPMTNLKRMVMEGVYTFGGILGIRALCKVLDVHVFKKAASLQTGTMAKIAPMLPAAAAMLLAALAPKVIKGSPKLVQGLQAGATLVFFDAALEAVLNAVDTAGTMKQYLLPGAPTVTPAAGWGAYNEYVSAPMGLEVESAMALDEYVSSPVGLLGSGMGGNLDVEEALAGNEGQAFETGYAGGSLAKTVFSNY